ncbi:maleylpyruvate isomerase family mycothiol-dependent enzyme [Mycobacterium sp. pV006]|uniref:maleylpyruvate isomerase family mycothiol-dependent enzyme n=1 Tax=Mycobacterium sp. pV006 TaxID=3238983 RepID=UPI00351BBD96
MTDARAVFSLAADHFVTLVGRIPADRWDDPGLGEWSVRDLVGHTSRSLRTISTYLKTSAPREDLADAVDYYVEAQSLMSGLGAAAIVERGRQAGRDLGQNPTGAVADLARQALADVAAAGDPLIEVIGGHGIRLGKYLPTRTFELTVHSIDIARATGVETTVPVDVLADAAALAARIGVALGHGPALLLALTGRADLPDGFSVV